MDEIEASAHDKWFPEMKRVDCAVCLHTASLSDEEREAFFAELRRMTASPDRLVWTDHGTIAVGAADLDALDVETHTARGHSWAHANMKRKHDTTYFAPRT
ncbi:MAG TPA: hypothetical protein VID26_09605 [Candidatus Limnocylindrales bacterium]|jgi:hypothetical protein